MRDALAKGEVGIVERKPPPTLREFAEQKFRPFVETTCKPKTLAYYLNGVKNLLAFEKIASARLDTITTETITKYATHRRTAGLETSSVNRELQVLRRMFALAQEWGITEKKLPKVAMLPGENHRTRVLSAEEEALYLAAATQIGQDIESAYNAALSGIRATQLHQRPIPPADPYRLLHMATILFELGLRPEEANRLRWEFVSETHIEIPDGKTENARRYLPLSFSPKVAAFLDMRRTAHQGETPWVFPAPRSGHVEPSTFKRAHAKACRLAGIEPFVLYTSRHTALTSFAPEMDPFTLAKIAGHKDMNITKRYVHPSEETLRAAGERVRAKKEGEPQNAERGREKVTRAKLA